MKNLRMFLLIVCLGFSNILFSQQPIVFEKTYRTETIDTVIMALTGAQTSDGGYLLGGYAAYGMYLSQMMFFKIDSVGNYQWKKMYGSLPCSSNMIYDMEPVGDGTFICCGEGTFSTEGEPGDLKPNNSMIMRVDEDANIIWHKEFDLGFYEKLTETAISDTGFICVGSRTISDKSTQELMWITGNFDGNYVNEHTLNYYDYNSQLIEGVVFLEDGNYAMGGGVWNNSFLLKVNQWGDTLKTLTLGTGFPESYNVHDIEKTAQGIIFCGSFSDDFVSHKEYLAFYHNCDQNFNNLEEYFFNHENAVKYSYGQKILGKSDDTFLIAGSMRTIGRGVDFWLKKLNLGDGIIWERSIGGTESETLRDVISTKDGGYLIVGESGSFNQYNLMYIIKVDSLGLGNYTSPVESYIINNNEFVIYPNPANDIVCIEFENKNSYYTIEIFDISGRQVIQKVSCDYQNYLNIENLTNGLYMVRIIYENFSYQNKLIINH